MDLEAVIADLVARKNAAPFDSAERTFYERQLRYLRYEFEDAGGLIEQADPDHCDCYCRPLD